MESRWKISWEDHYRGEQRRCRGGFTVVAVISRIDWAVCNGPGLLAGRNKVRQFFPLMLTGATYQA